MSIMKITGILVNKLFTSRLAITSLQTINLDTRSKKEKIFITVALCSRNKQQLRDCHCRIKLVLIGFKLRVTPLLCSFGKP